MFSKKVSSIFEDAEALTDTWFEQCRFLVHVLVEDWTLLSGERRDIGQKVIDLMSDIVDDC